MAKITAATRTPRTDWSNMACAASAVSPWAIIRVANASAPRIATPSARTATAAPAVISAASAMRAASPRPDRELLPEGGSASGCGLASGRELIGASRMGGSP